MMIPGDRQFDCVLEEGLAPTNGRIQEHLRGAASRELLQFEVCAPRVATDSHVSLERTK
jgi:hypothetical protein